MARSEDDEDRIERLVREAGPRKPMPGRIRAGLEASFWHELRAARRRRTTLMAGAMAASLVLAVTFLISGGDRLAVESGIAGVIDGDVYWQRGEVSRRLMTGAGLRAGDIVRSESGRLHITIKDGSAGVRLDTMTTLEIAEAGVFELKRGSVYVDSRDEDTDIVVKAGSARVEHLGTQFMVSRREEGLDVAVREGRILVTTRTGTFAGKATRERGELITIGEAGSVSRSMISKRDRRWEWVNRISPPFETDEQSLHAFLSWVARETGRNLHYVDEQTRRHAEETTIKGSIDTTVVDKALMEVLSTSRLAIDGPVDDVMAIRIARRDRST